METEGIVVQREKTESLILEIADGMIKGEAMEWQS